MNALAPVTRPIASLPAVQRATERRAPDVGGPTKSADAGRAWSDRPAALPGARYGVAAYLCAGGLTADRTRGEARLELSTRVLVDGRRVSVARRLDGGRTVGIEAVVG